MSTPPVRTERRGAVAWIVLDDPARMNAMSMPLLDALDAAVEAARSSPDVRCVVITGSGKAFSAGGDLRGFQADLAHPEPQVFLDRLRHAQRVFRQVETLPMPVIAGVNGFAIAGGLELVLCCDLVVASESATLGDGHAKFGIIPGGGASFRLPRKLPANRANQLLLTGELLPAATLHEWGLVNRVVPDVGLAGALDTWSQAIAAHSPLGLRLTKALTAGSARLDADAAAEAEIAAFARYAPSHDLAEGLAAFAAKRPPVFEGR